MAVPLYGMAIWHFWGADMDAQNLRGQMKYLRA